MQLEFKDQLSETNRYLLALEEAQVDIDALIKIRDNLQYSELDTSTRDITRISVEAICGRLGYDIHRQYEFLALEDDAVNKDISLEGISSAISAIWSAISTYITKLGKKIRAFFSFIESSCRKLEKKFIKLHTELTAMDDYSANYNKTINSSKIIDAFSIEGKANYKTAMVILDRSNELTKVGVTLIDNILDILQKTERLYLTKDHSLEQVLSTREDFKKMFYKKLSYTDKVTEVNKHILTSAEYRVMGPYAYSRAMMVPKSERYQEGLPVVHFESLENNKAHDIPVLTKSQMFDVIDAGLAVTRSTLDYIKYKKNADTLMDKIEELPGSLASWFMGSATGYLAGSVVKTAVAESGVIGSAIDTIIPNSEEMGELGEVVGDLSKTLTSVITGGVAGVASKVAGSAVSKTIDVIGRDNLNNQMMGEKLKEDFRSYLTITKFICGDIPDMSIAAADAAYRYVDESMDNWR